MTQESLRTHIKGKGGGVFLLGERRLKEGEEDTDLSWEACRAEPDELG